MSSEHGLNSLESDVENVIRCIGRVGNPVVLVGHSYGGTLITHASMDDRVAALAYLCALAPDEGESSQAQQDKFEKTPVFDHIDFADGRIWLCEEGTKYFCGDLSDADQKLVYVTAMAPAEDVFAGPYPGPRLEDEAMLVCGRIPGSHGQSQTGAFRCQANGCQNYGARQQSRPHAFSTRRSGRHVVKSAAAACRQVNSFSPSNTIKKER
jgi:pimeloyl-ACP methyl ester carboxylesterase